MIYINNQKVDEIRIGGGSTSTPFDFASIGYTGNEESLKSDLTYSKKIYDEWDATQTDLTNKFKEDSKLVYMPLIDTSKATDMTGMFNGCSSLTSVPQLNTSSCTNMGYMFNGCNSLKEIPQLDTSSCGFMAKMFNGCNSLKKTPIIDISSCFAMDSMFCACTSLTEVWFKGEPQSGLNVNYMFCNITTTGTFYYDSRYGYQKIMLVLPSGWTAQAWNYDTNSPA